MNAPATVRWSIAVDDCRAAMRALPDNSVDSVVTDPPYGLEFMGVAWDTFSGRAKGRERPRNEWGDFGSREHARHPSEVARINRKKGVAFQEFSHAWAIEAMRILKPGGHLLAFGGTRTYHRMGVAIEDAGFEIRDCMQWLYGSGFPKSLDFSADNDALTAFNGWGTALKPANEPIVMARKPLCGTVAANVLEWGTGGLNIDGCRIDSGADHAAKCASVVGSASNRNGACFGKWAGERTDSYSELGRWPANVILDDGAAAVLDAQTGEPTSRFFYVAKADRSERDAGCEWLPVSTGGEATHREDGAAGLSSPRAGAGRNGGARNIHPTVKPIDLMRYLCRLVTPPGGLVLDPFCGSGTTGIGALLEGFRFHGIEQDTAHACIAWHRLNYWQDRSVAPTEKVRVIKASPQQATLFGEDAPCT